MDPNQIEEISIDSKNRRDLDGPNQTRFRKRGDCEQSKRFRSNHKKAPDERFEFKFFSLLSDPLVTAGCSHRIGID